MATLNVQIIKNSGTTVSYSAAAGGGDQVANDGVTKLHVKNGGASPVNVTIDSPNTCSFGVSANAAHDEVITVAAGGDKFLGPFTPDRFNDASGNIQISYDQVVSVTIAAIK